MKNDKTEACAFKMLKDKELFFVTGGDAARQRMMEEIRSSGSFKVSESDRKLAISYTLGYLSLATCWNTPISAAFGVASLLYGCS